MWVEALGTWSGMRPPASRYRDPENRLPPLPYFIWVRLEQAAIYLYASFTDSLRAHYELHGRLACVAAVEQL